MAPMSENPFVRFTVLTDRLIRCEWQPEGLFENRPTQWVVSRNFPPVKFKRTDTDGQTLIETDALVLTWRQTAGPFKSHNLAIKLKSGNGATWHVGDPNPDNLGGTARTLDECDGSICRREDRHIDIHPGIFSRSGWAVLDDSNTMAINEANMPVERGGTRVQDMYFFAYGHDFEAGLRDFYTLTGRPPLLPEWSLGLWWSRWEKYKAEDLRRIVDEFEEHQIPLSTLVIDMDWHIIKNDYHGGWTGYTWNPEFFPDPKSFFDEIHRRGIHACLNLHPAAGAHPHEFAYAAFAEFMGVDPASKKPILFNPTDPRFLEGYFKYLHHPHEAIGVDFWWIDWQQGKKTSFGDIDPLWVLNHLHSADLARDGKRRPFTFSRWCGAGAHRYPVGFSGDTYRTWRSLRYQIEFTSRSANLGFGWWSHDIGAFARGPHNDELYVRWVQFGCFSPIFRFHNAGDPTVDHRPWSKESRFSEPTLTALRLRRALRPYIYTRARENADGGFPLVRPMYFHHGENAESYQWPGQYYFGPDLLVSPITGGLHPETNLATQPVWLPSGAWCEFFTGTSYPGGRVHAVHADLKTIPTFARAGAIIPTTDDQDMITELICFAGGNGHADLYLDDGESLAYQKGQFVRYRFVQTNGEGKWIFTAERLDGKLDREPLLAIILRGYESLELTEITLNGELSTISPIRMDNGDYYLQVGLVGSAGLRLEASMVAVARQKEKPSYAGCLKLLQTMPVNCHFARPILDHWEKTVSDPASLARYTTDLTDQQIRVLVDYLYDCGFAVMPVSEVKRHLVWWNAKANNALSWRIDTRQEYIWESTSCPEQQAFGSLALTFWSVFISWRIQVDLLGAATIVDREFDRRDIYGDE